MRTKKLLNSVEAIAKSTAQRYDLDYDLVLAAVRQVLQKFKTLNEMTIIEKLTWQKKAGIISETQYREAVEALSSKDTIRKMVRETLTGLLDEKKKKPKKPKEEKVNMDIDIETPEGAEGETPEGGEEGMSMAEPEPAVGGSAQDVQKELMDALEAAKNIGDVKLQRQISNALTYFTRQQVAGSEAEASTAAPAL